LDPIERSHDNRARLTRRQFVQRLASAGTVLGLAGGATSGEQAGAGAGGSGPGNRPAHLIPADKGLSPQWRRSLVERGRLEVWSGEQLRFIGMPVGGIACGQLYLAGDGRLWLWDIFKCNYSREPLGDMSMDLMTMCGHYIHPVDSTTGTYHERMGANVKQGFAICVTLNGKRQTRKLDRTGFDDITFRGEYPIGRVTFQDKQCPAHVAMEAFSPFVPPDARSSALPATVLAYTITNAGEQAVDVSLVGWLQNAVNPYDNEADLGTRRSIVEATDQWVGLHHTVELNANFPKGEGLQGRHGYGSMAMSTLHADRAALRGAAEVSLPLAESVFTEPAQVNTAAIQPLDREMIGALGQGTTLAPGQSRTVTFLLTWYFPFYQHRGGQMARIKDFAKLQRHYRPWFGDAAEVARHVAREEARLIEGTRLWNRTWYDSTLPCWLLDRAFIPTDALATQTVHWFDNRRFWGWEGVECCPGTCTHVWNYAQALARVFPELERETRAGADYGLAFKEDGGICYRGEFTDRVAADGQGGTIMRAWREHTMSADDRFLRGVWPQVKRAIEHLVRMDGNDDGVIEGSQANTLDASWVGPMAWISSIYCGALRAGAAMAEEMGDLSFAQTWRQIADRGAKHMVERLFNGEYFIHLPPDFKHINTNKGCHIDQVLGQSWAIQYGLPRVLPKAETESALNSLWRYNFAPDAGGYALAHTAIKGHRIYAGKGEAGLMMTTWPYGGDEVAVPGMDQKKDELKRWQGPGGCFDENQTGYEYQVAAHMVYEGEPGSKLVERGMAIARAIHDRYAPAKRNPYNEIECGDHYARAMAAYGVYLGVCGFEYHGPKGYIAFSPRLSADDFKAAFTSAAGWGSFAQQRRARAQTEVLEVKYGHLTVKTLAFDLAAGAKAVNATVTLDQQPVDTAFTQTGDRVIITLEKPVTIAANHRLDVTLR